MAEGEQASRTSDGGGPRSQADRESERSRDESTLEQTASSDKPTGRAPSGGPDVHLAVPSLHVGEIVVDVERLEAQLALRAQMGGLVNLVAGAHVGVDKVRIEVKDVDAEAMLEVRLDNTSNILDRTLATLDENPELMQYVQHTSDGAAEQTDDSGRQATEAGGTVGELTGNAGDKLGAVSDTVGEPPSSVAETASPERVKGESSMRSGGGPKHPEGGNEESGGEPEASSGGSKIAKGAAAAAGAAGVAGLAGAALMRTRPRRRILGIPIGRQNGVAALAQQVGDASDQVANVVKASKEIDKVRKTARKALS